MKYLLIILSLTIFGCQKQCEDKQNSFKKLTPPIVVIKKDIGTLHDGYYIVLQDKKGFQLYIMQYKNCVFSDTLVNNYNIGDTIK